MEKSSIQNLVSKIKRYFSLQRDFVMLSVAEKLTLLLTAVVVCGILLVLALLVLIFLSMAVGSWLSDVLGSALLANAIVALFYLLVAIFVYFNRRRLIADRVARFLSAILLEKEDNNADKSNNA